VHTFTGQDHQHCVSNLTEINSCRLQDRSFITSQDTTNYHKHIKTENNYKILFCITSQLKAYSHFHKLHSYSLGII